MKKPRKNRILLNKRRYEGIVVLVSGSGGNLRFLYHFLNSTSAPFRIIAVIADRNCEALEFCDRNSIPNFLIPYNRKNNNNALYNKLIELQPNYIVCHIHKILDEKLVGDFKGKLINLHYSILPKHKGLIGFDPIKKAFANHDKVTGVTCHYINNDVDEGEIIANAILDINESETIESISNVIFRCGCLSIINSLYLTEENPPLFQSEPQTLNILNRKITFNKELRFDLNQLNETFWEKVKEN